MRIIHVRSALATAALCVASVVCAGLSLADPAGSSQGGFTNPASPVAHQISDLFKIITIIAIVVGAFVEALLIYTLRKYSAARGAEGVDEESFHEEGGHEADDASPIHRKEHGNAKVELIIFAVTATVFGLLVLASLQTLWSIEEAPADPSALTVEVTGSQWAWEFHYPAQGVTELSALSEMHVPVNKVVRLNITARDVLHAVWIPDLGVKLDAVPGRVNHFWFNAEREGHYLLQCAEFCGGAHSDMHAVVIVESQAAFDAWIDAKVNPPPPPPPPVLDGETVNATLSDFHIAFERVLNINLGATVTFRITNTGPSQHFLNFQAPVDQTSPPINASTTVNWSVTFSSVATNAVVICPVAGHAAAGMTEHYNVSQGARIIDVHLHDAGVAGSTYSITPAKIDLTPGEVVAFHVFNDGSVAHNLKLGEPYNVVSPTITPGQNTYTPAITVAASSDSYWCDIPGHRQLGMEGQFSGAHTESGPQVPGFEAGWVLPALLGVGLIVTWRRRKA
jgi:cytochrome c oxidase subunit II